MLPPSPAATRRTYVTHVTAVAVALLVGLLAPTSAGASVPSAPMTAPVGLTPVTRVDPAVQTASGPVWLVTKNPLGSKDESEALLDLLERHISRQQRGDTIGLTTWSFHSQPIADALIAAHRRGVTVRVVVDQKKWDLRAVKSLRRALGTSTASGSYITAPYPQSTHTKVATFSRDKVVHISSGNVSNPRQWNHTVVIQNPDLHRQTSAWVHRLGTGDGMRYARLATPDINLHFYPGTVDPVLAAIRDANGEPISVQMSIWKGTRGQRIAEALIEAYQEGSPVTINTGEPWSDPVRAVAAAGVDIVNTRQATGGRAYVHDKLLVVGDDVYTGSTNWGSFPRGFSEVVAHIESAALADLMREYVDRTRVQAGATPPAPPSRPQTVSVSPLSEAVSVSFSTVGSYAVDDLVEFAVRAVTPDGRELAEQIVAPQRLADGTVDDGATLRTTLAPLPGGVPVVVEVEPFGDDGPVGPVTTARVTPYRATPATPVGVAVEPISPRRARVEFTPGPAAAPAPGRAYEVRWSRDGGRAWTSRTVTTTRLVIKGLRPGVRVPVQVRELNAGAKASAFTTTTWVRPTRRPYAPSTVSLRLKRPTVAVVRWQDSTFAGRSPVQRWVLTYRVDDGAWSRTVVRNADANRQRLARLPARGELDVRVAAVNRQGRSPFSPVVSVDLAR